LDSLDLDTLTRLFLTYLREKVDWARYYPWELPTALHPLIPGCRGTELSRDQWPVWMAGIHQFLYEAVLGSDIVKAAREKREAEGAVTIHQIIADDVLKSLNSYIPICIGLARRCQTLAECEERVLRWMDRVRASAWIDGAHRPVVSEYRKARRARVGRRK
jgi:hypothetical protein